MVVDKKKTYQVRDFTFKNFVCLTEEEIRTIWEWRNHPDVRKWMVTDQIIPYENHLSFIEGLRHRTDKFYWMTFFKGSPVAVLSIADIDLEAGTGTPGYYIDPGCRIVGMGILLQYAFKYLFLKVLDFNRLNGLILWGNTNSYQNARFLGSQVVGYKTINDRKYVLTVADKSCLDGVDPDNLLRGFVDFNRKQPVNWDSFEFSI